MTLKTAFSWFPFFLSVTFFSKLFISESGDIWLVPFYPVTLHHIQKTGGFSNTSLWKFVFIFWLEILCQLSVCSIFRPLVFVEGKFYEPCSLQIWSTIWTVILSYTYRVFCSYAFLLPTLPDLDSFSLSPRFFLPKVFSSKFLFSYSFLFSLRHYFLSRKVFLWFFKHRLRM